MHRGCHSQRSRDRERNRPTSVRPLDGGSRRSEADEHVPGVRDNGDSQDDCCPRGDSAIWTDDNEDDCQGDERHGTGDPYDHGPSRVIG